MTLYRTKIRRLLENIPFDIDFDQVITARKPTQANSMFLIHKEQGDWAENIVLQAINSKSNEYVAVKYGRDDNISAGDPGFDDFFNQYKEELNTIGKKPDILIYRKTEKPKSINLDNQDHIKKALAGIEIRSSSFLIEKYNKFMSERQDAAQTKIEELLQILKADPYTKLLKEKKPNIHRYLKTATANNMTDLEFKIPSYRSSPELRQLSSHLKELNECIKTLNKRNYLSVTPKVEDLLLVQRWIDTYNVPHFYMQVFFDKAYVLAFKDILKHISDPNNEDKTFSIESDPKNQGKTTIKINVEIGSQILERIDMPSHHSKLKRLERGRLLYYVTLRNGKGYLDTNILKSEIENGR